MVYVTVSEATDHVTRLFQTTGVWLKQRNGIPRLSSVD